MASEPPIDKRRMHGAGILVTIAEQASTILFILVFALVGGGTEAIIESAGILAWIPIALVYGFVRWWRFRYWIAGGEVRSVDGVLVRKEQFVPIDQIQAIDVTAGVIHRLFGIVQLEIKTAAAGTQVNLTAISKEEAQRLRAVLGRSVDEPQNSQIADEAAFGMRPRQVLLAGATSGKLGVAFAFVAGFLGQFDNWMVERVFESDAESWGAVASTHPGTVAAIAVGVLLASWLGSVLWTVIQYGNFRVARRGEELVIRFGLLKVQELSLPIERIRAVRYEEHLLRQPIHHGKLFVETVGHQEAKGQASTLHPFAHRDECLRMIATLLPQFAQTVDFAPPPRRAFPRFVFKPTILVLIVAGGIAAMAHPGAGALALALLAPVWLLAWISWRDTGLSISADLVAVRTRFLRRSTTFARADTVQVARTAASIFQRRRDLASVHLVIPTGPLGRTCIARDMSDDVAWNVLRWLANRRRDNEEGTR